MTRDRKPGPDRSVKSAERVFDLLEILGGCPEGMTFAGLLKAMAIPKSSLHALLEVTAARGYVEQDPATRHFSLGLRAWEAGQGYLRQHDFVGEAQKVMQDLVAKLNETVHLARLTGNENVYIAKVDSTHPLRLQSEVGGRLMAHATGVGKVLLAALPDAEVRRRFAGSGLPRVTGNTITGMNALLKELAAVRRRGFAIDDEEYTPGVFCLALPVHDGNGAVTAAISLTVPVLRTSAERLAAALPALAEASLTITSRCGGQADPDLVRLADPSVGKACIADLIDSGRCRLASFAPSEGV